MMSTSRCFNWSLEPWLPGETEILFDIHRTIELIPEMQGHGLGTSILRSLLQEADTANVPAGPVAGAQGQHRCPAVV